MLTGNLARRNCDTWWTPFCLSVRRAMALLRLVTYAIVPDSSKILHANKDEISGVAAVKEMLNDQGLLSILCHQVLKLF